MKIKFSHKYTKLLTDSGEVVKSAKLLQVIEIELDEMSKEFLAYDTDNGLYDLPKKGTFLMLIFQKSSGNHLFTTLRRFTPEKFNYYHRSIGQVFNVEFV